MALTQEQIKELKAQLMAQVQHLSPEQKKKAQDQIDSLSPDALETMLKQQSSGSEKTIFRMIIDGDVESVKISSDENALAVLDINPISEGHTLIIPKKPVKEDQNIPEEILSFAKKVSDKLSLLKPKSIEMQTETKFGEKTINLIPIYSSPLNLGSQRKKSSPQELQGILLHLEPPVKKEIIKIEKRAASEILKLKRRVP